VSRLLLKLGGELLAPERRAEADAICADVARLVARGDTVFVVHGGGPQTTALQARLGQTPVIVGGRRVTDADALAAIEMVVAGQLNVELCARLRAAGVDAFGLSGVSGRVIEAVKRPPRVVSGGGPEPIDFGHVGDVVGVRRALLERLAEDGLTPVLACLGGGPAGEVFNINADIVATRLAEALRVDRLLLLTGAPGVLRDRDDPNSRVPRLTVSEGREAIASGVVQGGMIPKLEEAFGALGRGVPAIQILGRLGPGDLMRAIDRPGAVGTVLEPDPPRDLR
jgi:acetylglutamate kinase